MSGERPYTLVAELTYRCPLRCVYCSNPLEIGAQREELDSSTWVRVIGEAEELGVVQLNLTGGEPNNTVITVPSRRNHATNTAATRPPCGAAARNESS